MCLGRDSRPKDAEDEVQAEKIGRPQQVSLLWSLLPILPTRLQQ